MRKQRQGKYTGEWDLERGRYQVPDRYMHVRCHMCIYGEAVSVRKSVCLGMCVIHPYL